MPVEYRTDYANEVHQLVVSVSRHLWVGRDGAIRYQQKPFDISLAKLNASPKRHIVHYLVRDHYSGAFYAEISVSPDLPNVQEFLVRAWSRKDRLSFSGMPDFLTVPKTVDAQFPGLLSWLDELGVEIVEATSGFQAGVRDLRTWEERLRYELSWYPADDLHRLPALAEWICYDLTERELFNRPHVTRWRNGLRTLRFPLSENPVIQIAPEEARSYIRDLCSQHLNRFAERAGVLHPDN